MWTLVRGEGFSLLLIGFGYFWSKIVLRQTLRKIVTGSFEKEVKCFSFWFSGLGVQILETISYQYHFMSKLKIQYNIWLDWIFMNIETRKEYTKYLPIFMVHL